MIIKKRLDDGSTITQPLHLLGLHPVRSSYYNLKANGSSDEILCRMPIGSSLRRASARLIARFEGRADRCRISGVRFVAARDAVTSQVLQFLEVFAASTAGLGFHGLRFDGTSTQHGIARMT